MPFDQTTISRIRKETFGCQSIAHLNNAGSSLIPDVVHQAMIDYLDQERALGGYEVKEKLQSELDKFYSLSANLVGGAPHQMAFMTSATDAFNRALSSIPFAKGDIILTSTNDYASNMLAFFSLKKRLGVEVAFIANTEAGDIDLEDLGRKLNRLKPKLVSVTHIPTNSGMIQPVEAIGEMVSKTESWYLVDACQSLGQIPVDVTKIKCDFLSGTMRKFLRGPRGAGLLFVSDRALDAGLEPMFIDMRGADWDAEMNYTQRKSAIRFEDWEKAFALKMGTVKALAYLATFEMVDIAERNQQLCAFARKQMEGIPGVRVLDRGQRQGSIVTFTKSGLQPSEIKRFMAERNINVSTQDRHSGFIDFKEKGIDGLVRLSPHYYNTEEEIQAFANALIEISSR